MSGRAWGVGALAALVLAGGCAADLSDVPIPDGSPRETYRIEAEVESALNLPSAAPVKLDGRTVGSVADLAVRDYVAVVGLDVAVDVELPVGTRAEVRLTAPVGEAFVALVPPEQVDGSPAAEILSDGDRLGTDLTSTAPDTTDLLTALSTAVTGGTYADVGTITRELATALDDRGDDVAHLLGQLDELATTANDRRTTIDAALDALDRLAAEAAAESESLGQSMTALRPALDAAVRLQDPATELLVAVTGLSTSTQALLDRTADQVVAQVGDAATVVEQIAAQQSAIVPILTGVSGFGQNLDRATPGDYATFDLSIEGSIALGGDLPLLGLLTSDSGIEPFTPAPVPVEETLDRLLSLLGVPVAPPAASGGADPGLLGGLLGGVTGATPGGAA